MSRAAHKEAIRKKLINPCWKCGGATALGWSVPFAVGTDEMEVSWIKQEDSPKTNITGPIDLAIVSAAL
jgi:hypothetical protein